MSAVVSTPFRMTSRSPTSHTWPAPAAGRSRRSFSRNASYRPSVSAWLRSSWKTRVEKSRGSSEANREVELGAIPTDILQNASQDLGHWLLLDQRCHGLVAVDACNNDATPLDVDGQSGVL